MSISRLGRVGWGHGTRSRAEPVVAVRPRFANRGLRPGAGSTKSRRSGATPCGTASRLRFANDRSECGDLNDGRGCCAVCDPQPLVTTRVAWASYA